MMLHGAYGRRYKTKESIMEDWKAGKDFKIVGGPYMSIRDTCSLDFIDYFSKNGEFYLMVSSYV